MKSILRVAIVASLVFAGNTSSYGQAGVNAVGGTNPYPRPQAVGGTNPYPRPQAVGGTNPYPRPAGWSDFLSVVTAYLGF